MRLVPFSYFCTCWNVSPSAPPSFSWLIDSIIRRMRTRLPTCLSIGFGAFLAIIMISYATSTGRNGVHSISVVKGGRQPGGEGRRTVGGSDRPHPTTYHE